jgi:hypothetical protein
VFLDELRFEPREVVPWEDELREVDVCEMRGAEVWDVDVTTGFATFFCCPASACCGMHAAAISTNKAAPRKADILVDPVDNSTSIAKIGPASGIGAVR